MKPLRSRFAAAVVAAFLCLPIAALADAPEASIEGRVLDPAGKPAVGALVLDLRAAERGEAPVTADNAGRFKLEHLPPGDAVLLAASGKAFARSTLRTGEPAEVRLSAPGSVTAPQMDALLLGMSEKSIAPLLPYREYVGDGRLLEMALRLDAARIGGPVEDSAAGENVSAVLLNAVQRDPAGTTQWSVAQLERFAPLRTRAGVALPVWQANAAYNDEPVHEALRRALGTQKIPMPGAERSVESVGQWFALASLAELLGDAKADGYMDLGLANADVLGQEQILKNSDSWGEALGPGGLRLLRRLDDGWPAPARLNAWCQAAAPLARFHPKDVPAFLQEATVLADDPAVKARDTDLTLRGYLWGLSTWRIGRARVACAQALAATDLPAAMEQARLVPIPWMASPAYKRIAESALAQGNKTAAVQAMKATSDGERELRSYYAARIRALDATLSDEMFAAVADLAKRAMGENYAPVEPSIAFYRAPYEPARSRITLEAEWARREHLGQTSEGMNPEVLPRLAVAMVALDLKRSVEMLNAVPERRRVKDLARAQILAYLLAAGPVRDLMPLAYAGE